MKQLRSNKHWSCHLHDRFIEFFDNTVLLKNVCRREFRFYVLRIHQFFEFLIFFNVVDSKNCCFFFRFQIDENMSFANLFRHLSFVEKLNWFSEKTDLFTKNSSCLYIHHCHIVTFFYILDIVDLFEMFWNQCNFFYKSDGLEMTMISPLRRYMSWNLPSFPRARVLRHFSEIGIFDAY